ncbi:hypothetical protein HYH02_003065 [Chlamydomonas schloesseri]|uniref:BTB domain-containing protein n=1 Tax=Chlamydomonas schloesseri TaxID=2026947 RepID=A0A835WR95_9CHLO|nr:hypothetical protein HYH02_003065 [Chlamydomonas schloesseri]|eukprot:KAG2452027.1 hypothetical protein HYH02_003065 [Chlamydomonas schloesseri]
MEGWADQHYFVGVVHVPAGSAWGPEECLLLTTHTAIYRLPLDTPAAGGPAGVGSMALKLLAGHLGEEGQEFKDGIGAEARFGCLRAGIALDGQGRLLLLDYDNDLDITRCRVVAPGGRVSTLPGYCLDGIWIRPAVLPNGYLAALGYSYVQVGGDSEDEDDDPRPGSWESTRIAVAATSFKPPPPAGLPPPRSLPADLGALLDAQPDGTADLVIRVGERRFAVHRAILSARCDYFKQRLAGDGFSDGRAAELELPDADPDAFAVVLRWLYTGGADIPPEHARGVAELADRLLLPELCAAAQEVLVASVDAATIVDSLLWAAGCCESRGGSFTQLLARLKGWYVEHAAEVRRTARDSLLALMTQQPDLMLELMEGSEQRAVKRAQHSA